MEDSRPTPKHNPMANNEATAVFYDFNKPLSDASCSMLASELAVSFLVLGNMILLTTFLV